LEVDSINGLKASERHRKIPGGRWALRVFFAVSLLVLISGLLVLPSCEAAPPGSPGEITSISLSQFNNMIVLTWSPPSDNGSPITGYRVYRSDANGVPELLASPTSNVYDDTSVEHGKTYDYWVSAVNANGEGPLSAMMRGTATTPPAVNTFIWLVIIGAIVFSAILIFVLYLAVRKKP
jgi:hypothetical protein